MGMTEAVLIFAAAVTVMSVSGLTWVAIHLRRTEATPDWASVADMD